MNPKVRIPVCGSRGSWAKWKPSGVSSSVAAVSLTALMVCSSCSDSCMARGSGGSSMRPRKAAQLPSSSSFTCRMTSSSRLRQTSGGRKLSSSCSRPLAKNAFNYVPILKKVRYRYRTEGRYGIAHLPFSGR